MMRAWIVTMVAAGAVLIGMDSVWAGNPCPISFAVYDLGSPSGVNRDAVLGGLQSQRAFIGAQTTDGPDGVRVARIHEGSPAMALAVGDVITEVDGVATPKRAEYLAALAQKRPGQALRFSLRRAGQVVQVSVTASRTDPLVFALIDWAGGRDDCTETELRTVKNPRALDAVLWTGQKLRCGTDVHKRLQGMMLEEESLGAGSLIVIRDGHQVLLSMVGFTSRCVASKDFDGAGLSKERVLKLFEGLSRAYVANRHRYP